MCGEVLIAREKLDVSGILLILRVNGDTLHVLTFESPTLVVVSSTLLVNLLLLLVGPVTSTLAFEYEA